MISTIPQRFKTDTGLAGYRLGRGPNLVLLHGVGLRAQAWDRLTQHLQDSFTIHALDMAGHGNSRSLLSAMPTLQDYSDFITDYLKTLTQPIYLAGHSMGAMIGLNIAMNTPDLVKSVAALNAIYRRSETASKAVQTRAAMLQNMPQNALNTDVTLARWFGDTPSDALLQAAQDCKTWLHDTEITEYYKAYHVFAHYNGPSAAKLAQLNRPALFLTGADEPNSTPDMSRAMASAAPLGIAKIIGGAAHMMPMTHAHEVALALKSHFSIKHYCVG